MVIIYLSIGVGFFILTRYAIKWVEKIKTS
jgi:hypothetical protein